MESSVPTADRAQHLRRLEQVPQLPVASNHFRHQACPAFLVEPRSPGMKTSTRLTSAANAQMAAESSRDFITMPSGAAFQIPITDAIAKLTRTNAKKTNSFQ